MTAPARPLFFRQPPLLLVRAVLLGALAEHPGRTALALAAIALGVALGVAVHLVNSSAVTEFELAARHLAGEADLVVRGPRAGFAEELYPRLARLPQVEAANPAVEAEVQLAGRRDTIKIMGFDPLRAAQVQPALLPDRTSLVSDLFDVDAVWLSPAAAQWLGLRAGEELKVYIGTRTVSLKVVGLLPAGVYRQPVAVMDIAAAQWRLARLGRLNRVDLKLKPGVDPEAFRRELQPILPPGVYAVTPDTEAGRNANLSRAYRLNLNMLALIALFTGAFLVFSSQVLTVLRRRTQFALLRALGMTRGGLCAHLVAEGIALGAVGSAAGVILGLIFAHHAIAWAGVDLGAGYFRNVAAELRAEPLELAVFFALGVLFATAGAAAPAWEAARRAPARALRAGDEEESLARMRAAGSGIASMLAGFLFSWMPPIYGLPIAGYAAIGLLLLGSVLMMPWLATACLHRLPVPSHAALSIAVAQLRATPRQAALGVAAIVISFSLMVSMLIMVNSFRASLEQWLERMLPADLYLRAARTGETGFFTPEEQQRLKETPGVARMDFLRVQTLFIDPARPAVTLLAGPADAARILPLVGQPAVVDKSNGPPVWVSEVAAELYGWRAGDEVYLPLGESSWRFVVAGIWRDYARQNGALAIERDYYIKLTGDRLANDAAVWLEPGAEVLDVQRALIERLPAGAAVEIATPQEVRAISLALFDRTFAITYALEFAAVLIGLFGISVSFGAQALARRREFGVLRHLGMLRREIGVMLASEGALLATFGVALGMLAGGIVSFILIHVVNRQSFHWSMDVHLPWPDMLGLGALVVVAAVATAVWSGRTAMRDDVIYAVREDW
jgi:putative ABC transport system permease protein